MLAGWTAPYSATAVERLLDAGAVPVGATSMDEFGMGSSGENTPFGPARNPWDTARTAGGSSSGSAVAVAADLVPLALGSDTGGSARQPAALCGVTGLRPTYGRVSRYGLVAFASSFDTVCPLARSARDLERALAALSGEDERDATSLPFGPCEPSASGPRLDGLRVGVCAEHLEAAGERGVRARVDEALEALRALGAELVAVTLPSTAEALATYYVLAAAEASSNLARFDGVRYGLRVEADGDAARMIAATRDAGLGPEVKRRIVLGTHVLSAGRRDAWHGTAQRARRLVRDELMAALGEVDVLVGPTTPTTAFRLGEKVDDPVAMYASDVLTVPAALAGLPAVSVPCGLAQVDGVALPVGLQVTAPQREDARCLRVARAYQAAAPEASPPSPFALREVPR
jgi:aspartyl-tRNA(Asn)/glutamyl-tRNA(Gln) amidotransferase subunit A